MAPVPARRPARRGGHRGRAGRVGRDLAYTGLGVSSVVAILVGVRRHRPLRPAAWYLMAASAAAWVVADAQFAWYQHVGIDAFPSSADALYLAA